MSTHPKESRLALLSSNDCGRLSRLLLQRHVRECRECTAKVARFEILRADLSALPAPELDWSRLAAEMKANIRLGIAAGECVRGREPRRLWNPRLAVAFASLTFLVAAGLTMKSHIAPPAAVSKQNIDAGPVIESTGAGIVRRIGNSSITLVNRNGAIAEQSVSAQGEISARYVEHGAVTINNVYLE